MAVIVGVLVVAVLIAFPVWAAVLLIGLPQVFRADAPSHPQYEPDEHGPGGRDPD